MTTRLLAKASPSHKRFVNHVQGSREYWQRTLTNCKQHSQLRSLSSDADRVTAAAISPRPVDSTSENEKDAVSSASAYSQLAKAKLSALVVTTTAAGFVAAGGPLSEQAMVAGCCVVGTALCSSSAAALNQIFERDRDAKMKRTQQRPLVRGDLTVTQASVAAGLWGTMGTACLALGTDPLTTALGVSNIALYAGLYTYMKPRSIYNTWVGAVVGAVPPVMGWTAATGGSILDIDAIILGSTLYLWQMPHFFALSYMYRADYKRGGFAMVPVLEEDGEKTAQLILRYAGYLSTVPFIATLTGVTSSMFALEGIALNAYALHVANRFYKDRTNGNARKVFLTSLWYLPSYLVLFLLHSKVWDEDHDKDKDVLRDALSDVIHQVREQGRQMCIHEHAVAKNNQALPAGDASVDKIADSACPVTLAKRKGAAGVASAADVANITVSTIAADTTVATVSPEQR